MKVISSKIINPGEKPGKRIIKVVLGDILPKQTLLIKEEEFYEKNIFPKFEISNFGDYVTFWRQEGLTPESRKKIYENELPTFMGW